MIVRNTRVYLPTAKAGGGSEGNHRRLFPALATRLTPLLQHPEPQV